LEKEYLDEEKAKVKAFLKHYAEVE